MQETRKNRKKSVVIKKKIHEDGRVVVHEYPPLLEWMGNSAERLTGSVFGMWLAVILAGISTFLYYPSLGLDQDIWFHLRYGEHFIKNHTWNIDHTMFSWTSFPHDWKYVTWMGSSAFYLFYRLFSHYGIFLLQYIIFGSTIFLLYLYLRSIKEQVGVNHLFAIFIVLIVLNLKILTIKPDNFSILFFTVAVLIYFRLRESKKEWIFLSYPILFLLWVNTHGGFIVGLFFITAVVMCEMISLFLPFNSRLTKKGLFYLAAGVVLSYIAIIVNPEGIDYPVSIVRDYFSPAMKETKETIIEYGSLWDVLVKKEAGLRFKMAVFSMLFMLIAFLALSVYLMLKKRVIDITSIFIVIFFYIFGMSIIRASQYFPLVWFFAFFYIYRKFEGIRIKQVSGVVSLAIMFILTLRIIHFVVVDYEQKSWFGIGFEDNFPVKEAEYIKKAKLPSPIFNDYVSGGYIVWALYPDYKAFIDPRYGGTMRQHMPTTEEFSDPKGVESYTKRYPFKVALIRYGEVELIMWFLKADWRIAYLDKYGLVIIHKSLVKSLPPEAASTDVSPSRLKDVTNPSVLMSVFDFYNHLNPALGKAVLALYTRNVSSFYRFRDQHIQKMEASIREREAELKIQLQKKETK